MHGTPRIRNKSGDSRETAVHSLSTRFVPSITPQLVLSFAKRGPPDTPPDTAAAVRTSDAKGRASEWDKRVMEMAYALLLYHRKNCRGRNHESTRACMSKQGVFAKVQRRNKACLVSSITMTNWIKSPSSISHDPEKSPLTLTTGSSIGEPRNLPLRSAENPQSGKCGVSCTFSGNTAGKLWNCVGLT